MRRTDAVALRSPASTPPQTRRNRRFKMRPGRPRKGGPALSAASATTTAQGRGVQCGNHGPARRPDAHQVRPPGTPSTPPARAGMRESGDAEQIWLENDGLDPQYNVLQWFQAKSLPTLPASTREPMYESCSRGPSQFLQQNGNIRPEIRIPSTSSD